jgi:hypothetical protein
MERERAKVAKREERAKKKAERARKAKEGTAEPEPSGG